MSEDRSDRRLDYLKERISAAFPKQAGAKLDKTLATDEVKYVSEHSLSNLLFLWLFLTPLF